MKFTTIWYWPKKSLTTLQDVDFSNVNVNIYLNICYQYFFTQARWQRGTSLKLRGWRLWTPPRLTRGSSRVEPCKSGKKTASLNPWISRSKFNVSTTLIHFTIAFMFDNTFKYVYLRYKSTCLISLIVLKTSQLVDQSIFV